MPFRRDLAADTLSKTLDGLQAVWPTLPAPTRAFLEQEIMTHGPAIAAADKAQAPEAIARFLEALWARRDALPPQVVAVLGAGQGPAPVGGRQPLPLVSDRQRQVLLERLAALADFRSFVDARGTAQEVIRLASGHEDRLTGAERAVLHRLNEALSRGDDPGVCLREVETRLGRYPAIRTLLAARKTFVTAQPKTIERGTPTPPPASLPPDATMHAMLEASAESDEDVADADLQRFANVYFPATVLISQRDVPLVVHVARRRSERSVLSEDAGRLTLKAGDLTIVLHAEGFAVTESMGGLPVEAGVAGRIVQVQPDRDCEPVVFLLTPQSVGEKCVHIYIDQFGRNILTQQFQVRVVADLAAVSDLANVSVAPAAVVSPTRGASAPPPDLELRVMLSADKQKLTFMLHGGGKYHYKPIGETSLASPSPRDFLQPMFDRLSSLAGRSTAMRTEADTEAIRQELTALGNTLYDRLFPKELKEEYGRTIRTQFAGKSLLITSDEPWIPWEIVRPFAVDADGNLLYDDPPLCEMFRLARWLAGPGVPDQVTLRQGVWVAPPDSAPEAEAENRYFQELHRRQWQVSLIGPLTRVADLQVRLQARNAHLLHFACHGNFDAQNPDNSLIKLEGGYFSPGQLDARTRAGLTAARPLVFLNACHSGQLGFALTGLGGWAATLLAAGASVFIGSLWEINGKLAARFAQEFYDRLWGVNDFEGRPQPLGQAFYEARMAIKQADEANPTWLAYVLYGDPYGRVLLGG